MCRLFGSFSVNAFNPRQYLFQDKCSLLSQSNANPSEKQAHGWGLAYLEEKMKVVKSPGAIFEEAPQFKDLAGKVNSPIVLAHIRQMSNPRRLPRKRLISMDNTQPFSIPNLMFIHNGAVNKPNDVDLGEYRSSVKGDNDSEVLFWLLVKKLEEEKTLEKALASVERTINATVEKGKKPFTAINMIFSDGKVFHAYNSYTYQPMNSLCSSEQGYYSMSYLVEKDRIIVMSEPSNQDDDWQILNNHELLSASIENGKLSYSIVRIRI